MLLPIIFAIDPGNVSGFALFFPTPTDVAYELTRYGVVTPTHGKKTARIVQEVCDQSRKNNRRAIMALEDQYIAGPRQKGLRGANLFALARNADRWLVSAEWFDAYIDLKRTKPNVWQSAMLGASSRVKREERKRRAVACAQHIFTPAVFRVDEADAVLIGVYEIRCLDIPILKSGCPVSGERI